MQKLISKLKDESLDLFNIKDFNVSESELVELSCYFRILINVCWNVKVLACSAIPIFFTVQWFSMNTEVTVTKIGTKISTTIDSL